MKTNSASVEDQRSGEVDPSRGAISLLYVDDEPDQLVLCKYFLEYSGEFRVDVSDSPREALRRVPEKTYSTIVADYQMPEMNGIEFLGQVKEIKPEIRTILFTSFLMADILPKNTRMPIDSFVQKTGDAKAQYRNLGETVKKGLEPKRRPFLIGVVK